jgi:hypothetical protein
MKSFSAFAILIAALAVPIVGAQSKPTDTSSSNEDSASKQSVRSETSLKVQVLISEYNGSQKLSSLPYTLNLVQNSTHTPTASVRMDTRVPVTTASFDKAGGPPTTQFTYIDVGTDIDCHSEVYSGSDGRYHLSFSVHRSSLLSSTGADIKQGETIPTGQPLTRSFQDSFDVLIRDGQTVEGSTSVDPSTGNVMKVDVTLNVEK